MPDDDQEEHVTQQHGAESRSEEHLHEAADPQGRGPDRDEIDNRRVMAIRSPYGQVIAATPTVATSATIVPSKMVGASMSAHTSAATPTTRAKAPIRSGTPEPDGACLPEDEDTGARVPPSGVSVLFQRRHWFLAWGLYVAVAQRLRPLVRD